MPIFTPDQIESVITAAVCGSDTTAYRGKPEYADRYIVGGIDSRTYGHDRLTRLRVNIGIEAMLSPNRALYAETLGVWHHEGEVHIDLGDTYSSLHLAMLVARRRGQIAIYDRSAERYIEVEV